ncbi:MAG: hypothetical protein QG588_348 [Candidatus Poribacteria bacterium]|nr:hypothetical protein [Candidatus Poribacteria bacterium]
MAKNKKNKKSKKQTPKVISLDDLDNMDDIEETVLDLLGTFADKNYDDIIAEDGYRIVGPAQAMLDYAKPLMDNCENEEEMEQVLSVIQMFWMLAIVEGTDSVEEKEIKQKLAKMNSPEAEEVFNMMMERFRLMFPNIVDESPFHIKERVLEEDIEEFEPFDESTIHISENVIPPTDVEIKLAETLRILDDDNDTEGRDIEKYEKELSEWHNNILDNFVEWCFLKGVPDEEAQFFAQAISHFLSFLYDQYMNVPSDHISDEAIEEFMEIYYIKKIWATSEEKSMMPIALKLFMRYLDEKGIVPGIQSLIKVIESKQEIFLINLKLYTNPTLKNP